MQGTEFEKIFTKHDEATLSDVVEEQLNATEELLSTNNVEPFDVPKVASQLRSKSRQRNKCDICSKVFKLQGRLAHHRSVDKSF